MKISQIGRGVALTGVVLLLLGLRGWGAEIEPAAHDRAVIAYWRSVQFEARAGIALIVAATVLWVVAVVRAIIRSRHSNGGAPGPVERGGARDGEISDEPRGAVDHGEAKVDAAANLSALQLEVSFCDGPPSSEKAADQRGTNFKD